MKLLILETKDSAIFNFYKEKLQTYYFDDTVERIIYEPHKIFYETLIDLDDDEIDDALQVFSDIHTHYIVSYGISTKRKWKTYKPIRDVYVYAHTTHLLQKRYILYAYNNAQTSKLSLRRTSLDEILKVVQKHT